MSAPQNDAIECGACGGCGFVPLPPTLQATLDILRNGGGATVPLLARALRVRPTAMNERVERLRRLGFVARERAVRGWLYRPTGARR